MWILSGHQTKETLRQSCSQLELLVLERTAELQSLSQRLLRVQDEERRRVARDLHDSTGQTLTALKICVDLLQRKLGKDKRTHDEISDIARLVAARETQGAWPRDPDGAPLYPGSAKSVSDGERRRRMESGEPYALRLDMQAALPHVGSLTWIETGAGPAGETGNVNADPTAWGDLILARKETPTSYHLAVVVDDTAQGVTDVVRGRDLFHATAVHRVLQVLLNLPQPRYHHHRLILDADGNKLSKSTQDSGLRDLRAKLD